MSQSCKTCMYLHVKVDRAGRRVVRSDDGYDCLAPLPDLAAILPVSVTTYFGFKEKLGRRYMRGDEGSGCPTFKPFKASL